MFSLIKKMIMKRGLFGVLFVISLLITIISFSNIVIADCDGGNSQLIMKLSSTTNAHGEFWNGAGNYPIEICYDDIFGATYSGANPHDCNGNNLILKLSDETNAHAEVAEQGNYDVGVCYGDLICEIKGASLTEKIIEINSSQSGYMDKYSTSDNFTDLADRDINRGGLFYEGTLNEKRHYEKFDLSSIPSDAIIQNATLYKFAPSGASANHVVNISQITQNWQEDLSYAENGNSFLTSNNPVYTNINPGDDTIIVDVTDIVKNWVESGETNYGFSFSGTGTFEYYYFRNAPNGKKPKLVINYTSLSSEDCSNNYEPVVSLSAETNAHLEVANENNYDIKICCRSSPVDEDIYWADMTGTPINQADLNDRVKLIVTGEGFSGEINFTIYKDISLWFDKKIGVQSSSEAFTTWRAGEKEDGSLEAGTYYFIAELEDGTIYNSQDSLNYGELIVSDTENNAPPQAIIIKPESGEIYFINDIINFTQASYDIDDNFNISWDFGDNNIEEIGNCQTINNCNTTYSYNLDGQKNIKLEVEDERGLKDLDRTAILVINLSKNGEYVFAKISVPEWGEIFQADDTVDFDASESYAIEVSDRVISCIAGACPIQTANGTAIQYSPQPLDDLEFLWEFSKDKVDWTTIPSYQEDGTDGAAFTMNFAEPEEYYVRLTVSINPSSTTDSYFITTGGKCKDNGNIWEDENGNLYNTLNPGVCELPGAENCCPTNYSRPYSCQGDIGSKSCQPIPDFCIDNDIRYCADYDNEDDCNDVCGVGAIGGFEWTIEKDGYPACGDYFISGDGTRISTSCEEGCFWDNGECKFSRTFTETANPDPDNSYTCLRVTSQGDCIGNTVEISWREDRARLADGTIIDITSANANEYPLCQSGSASYPCGEKLLPLFGFFQFIITLVLVLFFYLLKEKKIFK